jgi:polyhydroxyalkanoate synthase subunit PhaC
MPSQDVQHPAGIATPHDLLLAGSALGVASGMMPDTSWARFGLNLARRPGAVVERVGSFGRELASIATGTSDRVPAKPDKRFSDPAWQGNPLTRRSMQAYLAAAELVDSLVADGNSIGATLNESDLCSTSSWKGLHRAATR